MKKLVLFLNPDGQGNLTLNQDTEVSAVLIDFNSAQSNALSTHSSSEKVFLNTQLKDLQLSISEKVNQKTLRTSLVIPGESVLNCPLNIPARQFKKAQKALPFMVEDLLATDPEECFIATGERNKDIIHCAVIEKDTLDNLYTALNELELNPENIITDDGLWKLNTNSLHIRNNRAILVNQHAQSFAFDATLLDIYLDKLKTPEIQPTQEEKSNSAQQNKAKKNKAKANVTNANVTNTNLTSTEDEQAEELSSVDFEGMDLSIPELTIHLYLNDSERETNEAIDQEKSLSPEQTKIQETLQQYKKDHGLDYSFVFHTQPSSFYTQMAEAVFDKTLLKRVVNFMQGPYKTKRVASNFSLGLNWKPLAWAFGIFMLIHLGFLISERAQLNNYKEHSDAQTKQIFSRIFPGTKNFTRMRARVKGLLNEGDAPQGQQFLNVFAKFTEAFDEVNKTLSENISIKRLNYELSSTGLKLDLVAKDFNSLNALKTLAESSQGASLDIESTSTDNVGIKARVQYKLLSSE